VIPDHEKVILDHFFSTGGRLKPAKIVEKVPGPRIFEPDGAFSCPPALTESA